jgi:GNAT superfamily N-acetyltransferase
MSGARPETAVVARIEPFGPADFARLLRWVSPDGSPESLMQWAGPIFTWPLDDAQLERYLEPTRVTPPTRRGDGVGRAMVAAALRVAFEDLGLHRVALNVFDFNVAALRCYQSLGFVREGVTRDARRMGDTYWTTICCSLLDHEWRQRLDP